MTRCPPTGRHSHTKRGPRPATRSMPTPRFSAGSPRPRPGRARVATCRIAAYRARLGNAAATCARRLRSLRGRLDLRTHEAMSSTAADRSDASRSHRTGRSERSRARVAAVRELVGRVELEPAPQEVAGSAPLDQDTEHATYNRDQVSAYFAVATRAAMVLAAVRAPYRGRSTPVNAWWGSFDLAVNLFSGGRRRPI